MLNILCHTYCYYSTLGVLYILGLCEGNFCSEARGKEVSK